MRFRNGLLILLVLAVLQLAACDAADPAVNTEWGFRNEKTGVEYVACNVIAVKPLAIGEVYCRADKVAYYQIDFQDPSEFLCDLDEASGSSFVYRNRNLPDITIETFDAIAAMLYLDGTSPVMVAQLYADDEYLAPELRGQAPSQDTALVRQVTDALLHGEARTVPDSAYAETETYYLRLLSARYPGLYYNVCFFADKMGKYYVEDMATYRIVDAPPSLTAWFLGTGGDTAV